MPVLPLSYLRFLLSGRADEGGSIRVGMRNQQENQQEEKKGMAVMEKRKAVMEEEEEEEDEDYSPRRSSSSSEEDAKSLLTSRWIRAKFEEEGKPQVLRRSLWKKVGGTKTMDKFYRDFLPRLI